MAAMTRRVFSTLESAFAADDTCEVFEQDSFELDIRLTVPHELRPIVDRGTKNSGRTRKNPWLPYPRG